MLSGQAGRRPGWALVAGLIALACLFSSGSASAFSGPEVFEVNSTADEADAAPGSGGCLTAAGKCTLRAAIEESNENLGELDTIEFDENLFDGQPGSTIALATSLPKIVDRTTIEGHFCQTPAGARGPCVEVKGPGGGPAISVESELVTIEGIAVTDAKVGIDVLGASSEFVAARDWLGVALDGSAAPDETGIFLGPGAGESRIGSEGAEFGNVLGNSTAVALEIEGSRKVRVLGNYVGVGPDGSTPAPNGVGIRLVSTAEHRAEANSIGTRVGPTAAATPQCDGGCNVIAGSLGPGIEIAGKVFEGAAPVEPGEPTTMRANYVGLDATGSIPMPNGLAGIEVAEAPMVTIGGTREAEANRIAGGGAAVAGEGAANLTVRGNRIGTAAGVAGAGVSPGAGIAVDSQGLERRGQEAVIDANRIGGASGAAIVQEGPGALISHNLVTGGGVGIRTAEGVGLGFEERGNLIEGNTIEATGGDGILLQNNFNVLTGNAVSSAGGAGIHVEGSASNEVTENLIGGDDPGAENAISGSGGDAIAVTDVANSHTEIARNHGSGNGGLFIHLIALPGGKLPNKGIEPPGFTAATSTFAAGTAEPLSTVRVFRKASAAAGEVESFLGQAVVDGSGHWRVGYGELPPGTVVAATQTGFAGGTSQLAIAATPAAPPGAAPRVSPTPPQTFLLHGPRRRWHHRTARFRFASSESTATFQCRFDHRPFRSCHSPRAYRHLRPGRQVFEVRAVAADGEVDPTPARRRFTVLRRR
ncbi:MAG TPA: right-handed parallel beta-helix repeat-containing protein [Solirubrobacterales bacterium]